LKNQLNQLKKDNETLRASSSVNYSDNLDASNLQSESSMQSLHETIAMKNKIIHDLEENHKAKLEELQSAFSQSEYDKTDLKMQLREKKKDIGTFRVPLMGKKFTVSR
jgi:hypothetical protein